MKKRRMKARVCVPAILILIVITCVAYGTWSWVGATAWCAKYDDGWGIAHGFLSDGAVWQPAVGLLQQLYPVKVKAVVVLYTVPAVVVLIFRETQTLLPPMA